VYSFTSQLGSLGGAKQTNWSSTMTKRTRLSALLTLQGLDGGRQLRPKKNISAEYKNGRQASLMISKLRLKAIQ
jgi:hypothetical protein